jgi:FkbM family methyltransferase
MGFPLLLKRLRKLLLAIWHPRQLHALIRYRVLAGNEHLAVLAPDIRSVVDIGANRGQFALAVRAKFPTARIVSFEPLPEPAAVFRRIFAKDPRTQLIPCAIGARREKREMHVSARDDSSSLLPTTEMLSVHYPGTETIARAEVDVAPLDQFLTLDSLPRPSMLKIDVQGAEGETLRGCESLLPAFDYIYCECSFVQLYGGQLLAPEIAAWLLARGFDLVGTYHPDRDARGELLQADHLFGARGK